VSGNLARDPVGCIASVQAAATITASSPVSGGGCAVSRNSERRFLSSVAVIVGMLSLMVGSASATPTTVSLTTSGTLDVDSAGTLTATLAGGLPSTGFYDVYTGTFSVSETDFPALPITQPYAFTLTGSISVGGTVYPFSNTSLGTASASETNALAMDAEDFVGSPSGAFFPSLLPNTFYTYDSMGDITVAALTNLATVLPDTGPLSALFADGMYAVSVTGLTLTATAAGGRDPRTIDDRACRLRTVWVRHRSPQNQG